MFLCIRYPGLTARKTKIIPTPNKGNKGSIRGKREIKFARKVTGWMRSATLADVWECSRVMSDILAKGGCALS